MLSVPKMEKAGRIKIPEGCDSENRSGRENNDLKLHQDDGNREGGFVASFF